MNENPWVKSYCGGKPNYCTPEVTPDVASPPKRDNLSWVGLTPVEFNGIKDTATTIGYAIIKTEAILKEKNCG